MTIVSRRDRVGAATGLFGWVALAYLTGAVFSWQTFGAGVGPAFFPAAGVTVAAMPLSRRSLWPVVVAAIVLAELAVDLRYGVGWPGAVGFAVANSAEPLIGASLVLAWCKGVPDLRRRDHLALFVAGAAVVRAACGRDDRRDGRPRCATGSGGHRRCCTGGPETGSVSLSSPRRSCCGPNKFRFCATVGWRRLSSCWPLRDCPWSRSPPICRRRCSCCR